MGTLESKSCISLNQWNCSNGFLSELRNVNSSTKFSAYEENFILAHLAANSLVESPRWEVLSDCLRLKVGVRERSKSLPSLASLTYAFQEHRPCGKQPLLYWSVCVPVPAQPYHVDSWFSLQPNL